MQRSYTKFIKKITTTWAQNFNLYTVHCWKMLGQKAPVPLGLIEDEMNVRVLIFRYNELFEQDSAQLTEVWREEERMCSGR